MYKVVAWGKGPLNITINSQTIVLRPGNPIDLERIFPYADIVDNEDMQTVIRCKALKVIHDSHVAAAPKVAFTKATTKGKVVQKETKQQNDYQKKLTYERYLEISKNTSFVGKEQTPIQLVEPAAEPARAPVYTMEEITGVATEGGPGVSCLDETPVCEVEVLEAAMTESPDVQETPTCEPHTARSLRRKTANEIKEIAASLGIATDSKHKAEIIREIMLAIGLPQL